MLKKIVGSFTLILLMAFVTGCSGEQSEQSEQSEESDNIIELDMSTAAPTGDLKVDTYLEFIESVEEETNGEIKINLHTDSVLGTAIEVIEQVRSGSVDMVAASGLSHFEQYDDTLGVEELPFTFEDHQDAYDAMDGEVGEILNKKLEDVGFKSLAYFENGFRHFTNNERPIVNPEDLEGLKIRITESNLRQKTFKLLGVSPTAMDFSEVYTSLQQGVIDGQENPLSLIYSNNFNEVQDYLSLSGHLWGTNPLVVNLDVWDNMTPEHQEVLMENAIKYQDIQRQRIQESDEELIKSLEEEGMQINEVNKDRFKEATEPIWDEAIDLFGEDLINALEKYR